MRYNKITRRALQYALARYSATSLAVIPLVALVAYFYQHRENSVLEIFSGTHLLLLGSPALVAIAALRYRRVLFDLIDRHFFREQYDARQILTVLVERIRAINGVADLADLLCREADLAMHLEIVSLMAFDPCLRVFVDPKGRDRSLDASSALAAVIASASDPLTVDFEDSRSPLLRLPDMERRWLMDSGFRVIVPILARDGSLLGLIALGEKKSGLPFFREDRQFLRAIASSAGWVLELDQYRARVPEDSVRELSREQHDPTKKWKKESRIQAPPGLRLRALAEFLFSRMVFEQVLEPALRDLYDEYCEVLNAGRPRKAEWVRIRGYWSFWSAVATQLPISTVKIIYKIWQATQ